MCELLELDEIGIDDSFFDLGGNSLAAVRMVRQYHAHFGHEIPAIKVFQHPTIAKLAEQLEASKSKATSAGTSWTSTPIPARSGESVCDGREAIAVVGMSGRFPGASNPEELWRNLCNSVESISFSRPRSSGKASTKVFATIRITFGLAA